MVKHVNSRKKVKRMAFLDESSNTWVVSTAGLHATRLGHSSGADPAFWPQEGRVTRMSQRPIFLLPDKKIAINICIFQNQEKTCKGQQLITTVPF